MTWMLKLISAIVKLTGNFCGFIMYGLQINLRSQILSLCCKKSPVHPFSVLIFTFSGPLGL